MKTLSINNLLAVLFLFAAQNIHAETTDYSIRVDGLACPYCAYGIEKKLNQIEGVKFQDMDLEKGIVKVEAKDVKLQEDQLKQLFQDSGFTYRSKQEKVRE